MGAFSIWHWVIVLVVVLVLFGGKGKISSLMGDFGKGLKSFKKGMKDEEGEKKLGVETTDADEQPKSIQAEEVEVVDASNLKNDKAASS